ncbi:MAG TPA: radical SAM protein [bacterium]|nr:radical SAM protein [bacterium]
MARSAPTGPADTHAHPVHPLGSRARVLLTSVFGPYAQDDEFGSRAINPMELYHNQVTRVQGAFSLRAHHRSFGLMFIQANIGADSTLLDFPTLRRFIHEISTKRYDVVGISSIVMNVAKVDTMCRLVRRHLPGATIVVGGHVANHADIESRIDADHIVRGEGVRWMRRFLGEDEDAPLRHPRVTAGFNVRAMGIPIRRGRGDQPAVLIPSVGCPMGCNFCSTSAMFGGKGKFVDFYRTGDQLFEVMCELEEDMKARSFFVMDENFLLHRERALRLLDLMIEHDKAWALHVFSSAKVLRSYSMEQLVGLGLAWVWLGLEGENSQYAKVRDVDTRELVRALQAHGISVLGSTIIGLEEHTGENIDEAIEFAVSHDTEFHQFMLYTAVPGTPLHEDLRSRGVLLEPEEFPEADAHGQLRFNFLHPKIRPGEETELLLRAFRRDFAVNGPSVLRMARTVLRGWQRYKAHPDRRIRRRFEWQARELPVMFAGALWAARRSVRDSPMLSKRFSVILKEIQDEFGLKSRMVAPLAGAYLRMMIAREERRLGKGWTYEPPTVCETGPVP